MQTIRKLARTERGALILFFSGLALAAVLLLVPVALLRGVIRKQHESELKQHLHEIQLALERRAVDQEDGSYPASVEALLTDGYLQDFPRNPFSGAPMRCVATDSAGQPLEDPQPGDFRYTPTQYPGDPDAGAEGYELGVYF